MIEGQRGDDAVALDIAYGQVEQRANTKALNLIVHPSKPYHCCVQELILPRERGFEPIMFKFHSASRDDVFFEVLDENSNEMFEKRIRYATSSMPGICLEAAETILAFYGIILDDISKRKLKDAFLEAVRTAEGSYGSCARDHDLFECNAVVFIALGQQFVPENVGES